MPGTMTIGTWSSSGAARVGSRLREPARRLPPRGPDDPPHQRPTPIATGAQRGADRAARCPHRGAVGRRDPDGDALEAPGDRAARGVPAGERGGALRAVAEPAHGLRVLAGT